MSTAATCNLRNGSSIYTLNAPQEELCLSSEDQKTQNCWECNSLSIISASTCGGGLLGALISYSLHLGFFATTLTITAIAAVVFVATALWRGYSSPSSENKPIQQLPNEEQTLPPPTDHPQFSTKPPEVIQDIESRITQSQVDSERLKKNTERTSAIKNALCGIKQKITKPEKHALRKRVEEIFTAIEEKRIPPLISNSLNLNLLIHTCNSFTEADKKLRDLLQEGKNYYEKYTAKALEIDRELDPLIATKSELVHCASHVLGGVTDITKQVSSIELLKQRYGLSEGKQTQTSFPNETAKAIEKLTTLLNTPPSGIVLMPTPETNPHARIIVKTHQWLEKFDVKTMQVVQSVQPAFKLFTMEKRWKERHEAIEEGYQFWILKSQRIFAVPLSAEKPCLCLNSAKDKITGEDINELVKITHSIRNA